MTLKNAILHLDKALEAIVDYQKKISNNVMLWDFGNNVFQPFHQWIGDL
jgi:hypothetical protein